MKRKLIIAAAILCMGLTACSGSSTQTAPADAPQASAAAVGDNTDSIHSSIQHETESPDWVKALPQAQDENTKQLFIVGAMGMDKSTATVSMHERDENGEWKQILSTPRFCGQRRYV